VQEDFWFVCSSRRSSYWTCFGSSFQRLWDHQRRGQVPNEEDWNLDVCKEALEAMDMEDQRKDEDSKIDPPGKLKDHEWLAWNLRLENFLNSRLGASNVPLNYIIRKDIPDTYELENDKETLIHSCPF
jgi:hypothetical protein